MQGKKKGLILQNSQEYEPNRTMKYLGDLFKNPRFYVFSVSFMLASSITGMITAGSFDGFFGHTIWPVVIISEYVDIPEALLYVAAFSGLIITGFLMGAVCVLNIRKKFLYPIIVLMFLSVVIASVYSILAVHAMIADAIANL